MTRGLNEVVFNERSVFGGRAGGPVLPQVLGNELGLTSNISKSARGKKRLSRKLQRQGDRKAKKQRRYEHQHSRNERHDDGDGDAGNHAENIVPVSKKHHRNATVSQSKAKSTTSIGGRNTFNEFIDAEQCRRGNVAGGGEINHVELEDDETIHKLSKKLGIKSKSKKKEKKKEKKKDMSMDLGSDSDDEGALDTLIDGILDGTHINDEEDGEAIYEEEDEEDEEEDENEDDSDSDGDGDDEGGMLNEEECVNSDVEESDKSDGDSKDEDIPDWRKDLVTQHVDSLYAPTTVSGGSYVPPQRRALAAKANERVVRRVRGLINRLTDSNLMGVAGDIHKVYSSQSQGDTNKVFTDALLSATGCRLGPHGAPSVPLSDRFAMAAAALVATQHALVGVGVAAFFLQTLVQDCQNLLPGGTESERGKESALQLRNCSVVLAQLANMRVISVPLLFDLVSRLDAAVDERGADALLVILRAAGPLMRKNEPARLKQLILDLKEARRTYFNSSCSPDTNKVRIDFVLEEVYELKNNRRSVDNDPAEVFRSIVRNIVKSKSDSSNSNCNSSGAPDPLKISWDDLISAETTGRWWIVGSAWHGKTADQQNDEKNTISMPLPKTEMSEPLLKRAQELRMNTDRRRAIFCVIMTADDFLDAFEKILRLGLKGEAEREIVHVLVECCVRERTFNRYYALLATKLCTFDFNFKFTFQYTLWDRMRDLDALSVRASLCLARLYAHLIRHFALSISVLKIVNFTDLSAHEALFHRLLFAYVILGIDDKEAVDYIPGDDIVKKIFNRIAGIADLASFKESLVVFTKLYLKKGTGIEAVLTDAESQLPILKRRIKVARIAMDATHGVRY